jgi:voltage-gated sodium channel
MGAGHPVRTLANAVVLGLETYPQLDRRYGDLLDTLDQAFLAVFVAELLIRLTAYRWRPDFLRSGWNVFDLIVIGGSLIPGVNASVLRVLRVARIARAVRFLPDLRVIVIAVGRSLPGVATLAAATLLLVYVYGMIGWVIFDEHDPSNFANVGQSMLTMFVLLTLENLPTYLEKAQQLSDWAIAFYVSYVLLASFLVFNLFIGIVINSMEEARAMELRRAERELADEVPANDARAQELILRERVRSLRGTSSSSSATWT